MEVVDADWGLTEQSGALQGAQSNVLFERFAAALAKQKKAHLVTGDNEFKQVKKGSGYRLACKDE